MSAFTDLHAKLRIEGDPAATTQAIVAHLRLRGTQIEVLAPLVLGECEGLDRVRVRLIERATRGGTPSTRAERRNLLYHETFALGNGERVAWATATLAQHEARIAYLTKMRDGIDETIRYHEKVAARLRERSVDCMSELDAADLTDLGSIPPDDTNETGEAAA